MVSYLSGVRNLEYIPQYQDTYNIYLPQVDVKINTQSLNFFIYINQMLIHKQSLTTIFLVTIAIISTSKADTTLSNIMQLSTQQLLMESVQSLLPNQYEYKDITSVKLMSVTKKNSLSKVENLCNIIRAPNHQPYRLIKKLKHQIKNDTDWYKLVLQQFVIFKLQDINHLHYALDMEVVGKNLVLAFPNGELIFYQETQINVIKEVSRKIACQTNQYLKFGKITVADDVGIFISDNCIALINSTGQSVTKIGGFEKPKAFFTAIIEKDNSSIDLLVAEGRNGIKHYVLNQGATQFTKLGSHSITASGNKVVVTDFVEITKLVDHALDQRVLLILDPQLGIVRVTLPKLGGQQILQGQLTNMANKNCRMMKLADEKVFTSCPQVVSYNPKTNQVVGNPILSQLPIEFIAGSNALTIISHNSFQNIDKCSGSTQEGWFEGDSFHHTVRFGNNYVSVDEVSLIVWNIKLPSYFIACRGNDKLIGKYLIKFEVYSLCFNQDTGKEQCCIQIYQQQANVYDSAKGYHMFEIVGLVLLLACSTTATFCILYKRRKITRQYNELLEQNYDKIKNNNLSMMEDKVEKKEINVTEQNIVSANGRKRNFQELQQ